MENEKEAFVYTYSAKEQSEVERIRQKYMPSEPDKLEQIRRLDEGVTRKATTVSLMVGILGALILGGGMSCCMVAGGVWMLPGILLGVVGLAMVAAAYPLYQHILKKERAKIAPEILRLTDELMK